MKRLHPDQEGPATAKTATTTTTAPTVVPKSKSKASAYMKLFMTNIFGKSCACATMASTLAVYAMMWQMTAGVVSFTETQAGTVQRTHAEEALMSQIISPQKINWTDRTVTLPEGLGFAGLGIMFGMMGWAAGKSRYKQIFALNDEFRKEASQYYGAVEELPTYRRSNYGYSSSGDYYYKDDGFWRGFTMGNIWSSSSGGGSYRSSGSSGSSKNSGAGIVVLISVIAAIAATIAATYASYKVMRINFGKTPDIEKDLIKTAKETVSATLKV